MSDDLGGDGRNFQIASAIVHLDRPWSVSRLEQRIGRLDRMGRDPKRDVLLLRRQTEDAPAAVDPDALGRWLGPHALCEAVRVGAAVALEDFQRERAAEIEDAARALEEDLRPDLRYFAGLLRREQGAEQRAAREEIDARQALLDAVRSERAVLDALALVIGR